MLKGVLIIVRVRLYTVKMAKVLEVCVDNHQSAVAAMSSGANRLELCSSLTDGGLTPFPGFLKQIQAINTKKIPVFCMLRCRNSNFVYSEQELDIMVKDAKILRQNGADGFVFGALLENGGIDLKKCREIIKCCYPLPVTFHRAFDLCTSPTIQLESVIDLGFTRVLTSGQKKTAVEGIELINKLIKRAKDRIIIIPGAGVNKNNIQTLMEETEAVEYHGSFKSLTKEISSDDDCDIMNLGNLTLTDSNHVAEVVQILKTV